MKPFSVTAPAALKNVCDSPAGVVAGVSIFYAVCFLLGLATVRIFPPVFGTSAPAAYIVGTLLGVSLVCLLLLVYLVSLFFGGAASDSHLRKQ